MAGPLSLISSQENVPQTNLVEAIPHPRFSLLTSKISHHTAPHPPTPTPDSLHQLTGERQNSSHIPLFRIQSPDAIWGEGQLLGREVCHWSGEGKQEAACSVTPQELLLGVSVPPQETQKLLGRAEIQTQSDQYGSRTFTWSARVPTPLEVHQGFPQTR